MEILILGIVISLLIVGWRITHVRLNKKLEEEKKDNAEALSKMLSQKKSSEVRLGQISENLAPFLKDFKYNPKKAHFMGAPIDYVIFENDKVVFLEVKSGKARLNKNQQNIKALIQAGKVTWEVMRIS